MNYAEQLTELMLKYPDLTYQNDGYDNIPSTIREANAEGDKAINAILKQCVAGFIKFQNFKVRRDGTVAVRCQVSWGETFIGVQYTPMSEFETLHKSKKE